VLALMGGIIYHSLFMLDLRKHRNSMAAAGTLETSDGFPASFTLILAVILLLVGIFAIISMLFRVGPFI